MHATLKHYGVGCSIHVVLHTHCMLRQRCLELRPLYGRSSVFQEIAQQLKSQRYRCDNSKDRFVIYKTGYCGQVAISNLSRQEQPKKNN
jgi:hypothetical protein